MKKELTILVTGGLGFIGSHTVVELLTQGMKVVVIDNLMNSEISVLDNIEMIVGIKPLFYKIDVADKDRMSKIFVKHKIDAVIHFAGHKSVNESVKYPTKYYRNNIETTITLLELMKEFKIDKFIFSSSATVYGLDNTSPLDELMTIGNCTNPYGWSKFMNEQIIKDISYASNISSIMLRYFNPIGAHKSGLLGEKPVGIPNNLMPYITQVASGKLDKLYVFGDDYSTNDGTCIRDYIHVVDLAKGHLAALDYLLNNKVVEAINLGTGKGYSVLEVISAFEVANKIKIPYEITGRRQGDIALSFSNTNKSYDLLKWKAKLNIEDMCRDSWLWTQKLNHY